MNKVKEKKNTRDHADFQDSYRRSSNFGGIGNEVNDKLKIIGDGEVSLNKKDKKDSDMKKINDVLNDISKEE